VEEVTKQVETEIKIVLFNNDVNGVIQIFPNPATDYVFINIGATIHKASVTLSIMNGKLVMRKDISSLDNPIKFPVSNLPRGLYIIQILDNNLLVSTHKLIIK
jgi:hypothetical protein